MHAEWFQPPGGTDLSVVNAARVSFDKVSDWEIAPDGTKSLKASDVRLIQYLARGMSANDWQKHIDDIVNADDVDVEATVKHLINMAKHWVPFTHTMISLRMEAPVPIRTQCFKHKQGFTESEESRRYISSKPTLYVPDFRKAAENVKQGSSDELHAYNDVWKGIYVEQCEGAINLYQNMIVEGIAAEQARFILPQGCEVHWIWSGNLASYARYYNQRTDSHAQKESQILAEEVSALIGEAFPVSWSALTDV